MNLAEILTLKFPYADFTKDILLSDEGSGVFIKEWNMINIPSPSTQDLEQWEQDVYQSWYDKEFKHINKILLDKLNEIDSKSIRALRTNNTEKLLELESQAAELRLQLIKDF